jgi:hypothetical protein
LHPSFPRGRLHQRRQRRSSHCRNRARATDADSKHVSEPRSFVVDVYVVVVVVVDDVYVVLLLLLYMVL